MKTSKTLSTSDTLIHEPESKTPSESFSKSFPWEKPGDNGTHRVTIRANGSRRVTIINKDKLITDQAAGQELTMASIVKKLEKGIMPRLTEGTFYSTDLGIRNLQDVVERKNQIDDLFYQLPTEIRSAMQNDIQNFESVIFDPKNTELLQKHGLLVKEHDKHKELVSAINSLKPSPDDLKPVSKQ
ncbi:MAG: internal scaffolding protein [Wigfec virus K19_137]|nr:MAG: internal scaffolding protein [Wigfec virus K19_137]